MIGLSFTGMGGLKWEREKQTGGDICVNKWQFNMLKKVIKTHTARLDFVDISGLLFFTKGYRLQTRKTGDR